VLGRDVGGEMMLKMDPTVVGCGGGGIVVYLFI
jgi:hypothetical protein